MTSLSFKSPDHENKNLFSIHRPVIAAARLGQAQAQRMYDSAGRLLGRVDGERIYDGSGHLIGRAEGLRRRQMVIYFYFFM
jgi:hypothetical protein